MLGDEYAKDNKNNKDGNLLYNYYVTTLFYNKYYKCFTR